MSAPTKVSVVIPAYNEAATLRELLPQLSQSASVSEILVINDGSTDETARLSFTGVRVVSHPMRRGNGAAVKTGLRQATGEFVLVMDADGQHTLEELEKMAAVSSDFDLVVGARPFLWYKFRDFGNRLLSRVASAMSAAPVSDLTSGLRRLRRNAALRFLDLYPQGFSFPTTSTLLFLTSGYTVTFIPIVNRPRPAHASPSKLRPIYEGIRFLSLIYRIVLLSYPLRFFAPLGLGLILFGVLWTIRTMNLTKEVSAAGTLLFLSGLTLLLFGTIADQLSQIRRSISRVD